MRSYNGKKVYRTEGYRSAPQPIMDNMNNPVIFDATQTWYAAAYVNRINLGYLKEPKYEYTDKGPILVASPNKEVVRKILDSKNTPWTEEDIAVAEECRNYWQGQLLKLLAGPQSDFVLKAIVLAGKDEYTTQFEISIVSSLISSALKGIKHDDVRAAKDNMASDWLGSSDDKVTVDVKILQVKYVPTVGRYIVEGVANDKDIVSWWSKDNISNETVRVRGRIRNCQFDKVNPNLKITFLNYVKIDLK